MFVPAGVFLFGAEKREVNLPAFWIDKFPVTNRQYESFCRATGYRWPKCRDDARFSEPEAPVVGIGVQDAEKYARWVGKALPTEEQWEKACRGTDGRLYPWGDAFDRRRANLTPSDLARDGKDKERRPRLVPADRGILKDDLAFPLHHIVGNVREWTSTPASEAKNEASYFVVGGSAADTEKDALAGANRKQQGADRDPFTGFRLAWPR